jgi:hypothetical protein
VSENLQAPGIATLRPASAGADDAVTIVVAGAAGSGTSEVAAGLEALGVAMSKPGPGADTDVIALIGAGDVAGLQALADERNVKHLRWGFEYSDRLELLAGVMGCFEAPRVIVCFRDVVTMAQREVLSGDIELSDAIGDAAKDTAVAVAVARSLRAPVLLISYEPAMSQRASFLSSLRDFIGVAPGSGDLIEAPAEAEVGPPVADPPGVWYDGWFEQVVGSTAHGWACRMPGKSVCTVEIVAGGRVLGRGPANLLRRDLIEAEVGERGFMIELTDRPRDDVFARVVGTNQVLNRSDAFEIRIEDGS